MIEAAAVLDGSDLAEGRTERLAFRVGAAEMEAFAVLSGDRNPLHLDEDFARGRGFAGRVVYGGLILAQVSRLLGMRLPGRDGVWVSVRMDFRAPLYLDEDALLEAAVAHVSEAGRLVKIRLAVKAGDRLVASGSAESVMGLHG
ncbi:MAG: hypothetical protein H7841_00460 [Magnetospirillum sp. WYHS-4]